MERIVVCSNEWKKNLLLQENSKTSLKAIKFYTKQDFFQSYFFSYDYQAISYLMKKYHYPVHIAKELLSYLYFIEDKPYQNKKLVFLKEIKQELMKEKLLSFSPTFREYLKDKEIDTSTLYDLDLFEDKIFQKKIEVEDVELNNPVYEFQTMEEEIHFVCVKIRELLKQGISLSHIVLCNVSSDYYFLLDKMFSYYGIPVEIPYQNSIYSTTPFQEFIKTGNLRFEKDNAVNNCIRSLVDDLVLLDEDEVKKEILIEESKHRYLPNLKYQEAVQIKDLKTTPFQEDEYVFVLGFNQDALPRIYKDTGYLSDQDKEEVDLYTSKYFNQREKKIIACLLSNIKHLTISYKLSSPFQTFYPSSMIDEYHLEVVKEYVFDTEYSTLYNKIRLGEMLDQYYVYGEKDALLDTFHGFYGSSYKTYQHAFTGISLDSYLNQLSYPLRLSYTSFNSYQECKFKYYVNYVLKLGDYEETFAAIIGSLYHHILSICRRADFDLDREWNSYLEKKDLRLKDTVLLVRIRKDLETLLQVLEKQREYTQFDTEYYEKECRVKVRDDISVEFVGYIDKIMTYQNISDTYFSIVDYKTGSIDTHIEPMKYGLHMQLPIYLYLIDRSKIFDSPIFTGIYYQNILFNYPTWSKNLEKDFKDNYQLKGYSTNQVDLLEKFDGTYQDSELVKGMKYHDKFDRFSKVLSDLEVYQITQYTDQMIQKTTDDILKADFQINPKIYNKENISCEYCKYHDLCFSKESDFVYLPKVEDFSFLE